MMRRNKFLAGVISYLALMVILAGCATVKEIGKGFLGVSTKVLEDGRPTAVKKTFNSDFETCYNKTKTLLKEKKAYIYCEDSAKKMIAFYISEDDTTPVGLFFTEESSSKTQVEVSSPSTFAKDAFAKTIFEGISKSTEKGK